MAEVNLFSLINNLTDSRSGFVGGDDTIDTYSFNVVSSNSNINISLTGMSADADLRLFRDFNGNGIVDSNDRQLGSSGRGSNLDESINLASTLRNVDVGSYVIEVDPFQSASTAYDLKVSGSANGNPSLLLPAEREVGALTSRRTFSDSVTDSDTVDTYRFNVTSGRTVNFSTVGAGQVGVDMRLIKDGNNNRDVNTGEELARSATSGSSESISQFLNPGTYYLQVYNSNSSFVDFSTSDYTLAMG